MYKNRQEVFIHNTCLINIQCCYELSHSISIKDISYEATHNNFIFLNIHF